MDNLFLPLWLKIGLTVFVLLIAIWQVPRIRVRLSGNHSRNHTGCQEISSFKHWGKLITGLILFVVIGFLGDALLWTLNTYKMAGAKYTVGEDQADYQYDQTLPLQYAYKKPLWHLGFVPIPTLINIPAGKFDMGNNVGKADEKPIHKVIISSDFLMSQYEITFEQYDYFIWRMRQENKHNKDYESNTAYSYPDDEDWGRGNHPVINVSWWDARAYTNWLSKHINKKCRLPSESEWEYAARSGTTTDYPWGNEIGENNANCSACSNEKTKPLIVGSFKPNNFNLHDMHGNVWEWVLDAKHFNYEGAPNNSEAWDGSNINNLRVLRGGSWYSTATQLRSSDRFYDSPKNRDYGFGFRVACSIN